MEKRSRREIEKELTEYVKKNGYKKKKGSFYKEINSNMYGILFFSFCSSGLPDSTNIYVHIGVIKCDIQKYVYELTGRNNLSEMRFEIGTEIGYLTPKNEFKEWTLSYTEPNEKIYSDILKTIEKYAPAYWSELSNEEGYFNAVFNRTHGVLTYTQDRYLPILYYMRREKEKGLQYIEKVIERMKTRKTDEELRKGCLKKDTVIIRAGEGKTLSSEELEKLLNEHEGISIIAGDGKVDPTYLTFKEKYQNLK